jgi:hypothetical protein
MNYIDADKLRSVLQNTINSMKEKDVKGERYDAFLNGKLSICEELLGCIAPLQQEQPDNEDIDKVAQELYEHLYELKRRNNVPTNLYDKQEISALWKAGIEYAYNHPKQEQPEVDLEKEEFVGVAESPLKTFPRVNDFECGGSYRH